MGIAFISHFNRVSMTVAGDAHIMHDFGLSPTQMGAIYSSFLLAYTIGMTPMGAFADRVGVWVALGVMMLGTATFGMLTGGVGHFVTTAGALWMSLLGIRALMGLFTAPLHPCIARTNANWFPPERRGMANGFALSAAGLGIACTFFLFGAMMERFGWQNAFVVSGITTAILGALWLTFGGDSPRARQDPATHHGTEPDGSRSWRTLLRSRPLIFLTISYGAFDYFQYLFFYWMHYYFDSVLHLGPAQSTLFTTIPLLAFTLVMPFGGLLTDRLERRYGRARGRLMLPVTGMVLGALFLFIGVAVKDPIFVVVCFSLAMGSIGAVEPPFWLTAIDLGGTRGTTAAGIMNTGGNFGGFLAPIVTPWISTYLGWQGGLGFGALLCLAGAGLWYFVRPALADAAPVHDSR